MIKKIAFTMYPVKDIMRARNFYENILGLSATKSSADGEWIEYDLPQGGCFVITTLAKGAHPSDNAGGSVAFEVDDLEEYLNKLKQNDIKVKINLQQTLVCKLAIIYDSEGNTIILHQLFR